MLTNHNTMAIHRIALALACAATVAQTVAQVPALRYAARMSYDTTQPEQIHFAYDGSSVNTNDGMIVSWVTGNATATSTVRYGTSSGSLGNSATGDMEQYLPTANGGLFNHHVHLTGLAPASTYFFSCGDANGGWSPVYNFTTAPASGSSAFPVNVIVYGDMGVYNSHPPMLDVGRVLNTIGADFIWHVGDISYADDAFLHDPLTFGYENTYNWFMRNMSDTYGYMQTVPYMVNPGNHEAECHSPVCILDDGLRTALQNFSAYNHRWRMPYAASKSTTSMWYSFRYGSVHMINIDTETDFVGAPLDEYDGKNGGFGDQLAWVEADLAQAAADRAAGQVSWIIASGHRPMYSRNDADPAGNPSSNTTMSMQAAFEPLFNKYGVDLYICGHVHSYEAIYPVLNGTNVQQSYENAPYTAYVITGAAGNTEGLTEYSGPPLQPWERRNISEWGISTMVLHNESALTFNFRKGEDGSVLDEWTLTKQR